MSITPDPVTGRRPYYCDACKVKYGEGHRMAVTIYRDRRRARGECVQCGSVVTRLSSTGVPVSRCAPCARLQADTQRRIREAHKLASFAEQTT